MTIRCRRHGSLLSSNHVDIALLFTKGIASILRNTMSLLLAWIVISGSRMNPLQTQAMMASPHPFLVEQYEETITLKIKGDEIEHWVTDKDGKYIC